MAGFTAEAKGKRASKDVLQALKISANLDTCIKQSCPSKLKKK
jgi:hypothetical protein